MSEKDLSRKMADAISEVGFTVDDFDSRAGRYAMHCPFCWEIFDRGHSSDCIVNDARKLIKNSLFFPKFDDPRIQKIADECGLTIDGTEQIASSREIEFFIEKIIKQTGGSLDKIELPES